MKFYLTTDTHFNHAKIKDLCGRPDNFEQLIIDDWRRHEEGVLIHLGDICIGQDSSVHENYIRLLSMKTWLIRGNHDNKSNSWYLDNGWDMVCERLDLIFCKKKIAFTHKPIADDGWYDLNIHGHHHNSKHHEEDEEYLKIKNNKQVLISIENYNYKLIDLEKLINQQ
jgi:calcineurin-like phosphoesterase family protein